MSSSYTDLQAYRACPRLFGFQKLGYTSPKVNEPMTTGQLVHAGIAAHFKGRQDVEGVITALTLDMLNTVLPNDEYYKDRDLEIRKASVRARELSKRYIKNWAKDYRAVLVEPTLELDGVVCHPDLIAYYGTPKEQRVIVDFKTSYHPDDRWYDMSNQTDLYAYAANLLAPPDMQRINLIIYDIISEEGIYRHMRPPRLSAGKRLYHAVKYLDVLVNDQGYTEFLDEPHPNYTCPSRCDFFTPCWLYDTDSWDAAFDYLSENFIKEEK